MHRYTVFGDTVHFPRADLDFQRCCTFAHYRRMQRLITVHLGVGNIIIELVRQRVPEIMYNAQRRVTILHRLYDHPQCQQVMDIIEVFTHGDIFFSFLVDTVNVLCTAGYFSFDPSLVEFLFEQPCHFRNKTLAVGPLTGDQ